MKIGIIGGGLMGVSLGYFLTQLGAQVQIFEASSVLGGIANTVTLEDGVSVDRFYHTILSSDSHLLGMCNELNLADQLRFRETRTGFYYQGRIHSMNNLIEFLRFPPLGWIDRFRLGLTVLDAQRTRDWQQLESISVEKWLLRKSGRRTFENIWRPLLKAKFEGSLVDEVPATWMWSRLVRMKSARKGPIQKEEAGHLIGGYVTLIDAIAKRIESAGGEIHLDCPVQEIVIEGGRACGVRLGHGVHQCRAVVAAVPTPKLSGLIHGGYQCYRDSLNATGYLGLICPMLVLDRPLSGFWTLNITDDSIPFTGIIETTTYIDPKYVGGDHLVYLPKYTAAGSPWQHASDQEIREIWLNNLEVMFPEFDRGWIRDFRVHRERFVEPLHRLNSIKLIPPVTTPIEDLYLATTAQIYPGLTNGETITRHTREVAGVIWERVANGSRNENRAHRLAGEG